MYVEYLLYLKTLSEAEKNKQIIMSVLFWTIVFAIAGGLEFLKYKYKDKTKKKKLQKFLEKI